MTGFRPPADAWSRRDFMRNGFGSLALLCTIASPSALRGGKAEVTSARLRAQARSPFEPFQRDLPRIPELLPVSSTRTQDTYEIAIREGMADILPGFQTPIYGYEGVYPGPTIRARKGRKVVVRQRNTLPFESNVHLHGGYVPAAHDGHPMDVIAAGRSFDYHYPNEQDACSLWYHDHAHGRTSKTLYYGLLAMYILEDELEDELGLPQGEYDVPLVIADHAFNKDGSFRYAENVDLGFRGDTILVNGAISPRMAVQRRKYRLRFLNASNARSYTLRLGRGRAMQQIAGDGGLLERPVPRARVPLHPAERIDFVIDFSAYGPGDEIVLHNEDGTGGTVPIMRFDVVGGGEREQFKVPSRLRPLEPLPGRQRAPALGARPRHVGVADQRARLRPDPDRRPPPSGHHGDMDLREPLQPRAPDAHPRLPVPGARAHQRAGGDRGPDRLEGHRRRAAGRDGDRAGLVRALRRQIRLPLPRARARRQGDDAPARGGLVKRLTFAAALVAALAFPAAASRGPEDPGRPTARSATAATAAGRPTPSPSRSARRSRWTFDGTSLAHNVRSTSANWNFESPIAVGGAPVDDDVRHARHLRVRVPAARLDDRHGVRHRRDRRPTPAAAAAAAERAALRQRRDAA